MTNTQRAELFLLGLYDLAEEKGHGIFYSLNEIAAAFGVTDVPKIHNIGNYLVERGQIRHRGMGIEYRASITGQGSVEVERGGTTGVIGDYRARPLQYLDQSIHFHGSILGSNVAAHSPAAEQYLHPRPQLDQLLTAMIAALRADTSLSEQRRNKSLADVSTLRGELLRECPRRSLIECILSDLGNLASLASLAHEMHNYLTTLFH